MDRREPWKVKYFAIGNENWGCGGNMTAEFYANQMRQYSTFLESYAGNQLYVLPVVHPIIIIAWTETFMKDAGTRSMFPGLINSLLFCCGWMGFQRISYELQ